MSRELMTICYKVNSYDFNMYQNICKELYPRRKHVFIQHKLHDNSKLYSLQWNLTQEEFEDVHDEYITRRYDFPVELS